MKKLLKKVISLCMVVLTVCSCIAGCGQVEEVYDENKTQLFVKVFNGGAGTTWIEKIRDEFNANDTEYEVILRYEKLSASAVISEIELNAATSSDIYFTSEIGFQSGIYEDRFEDLSDVLNTKVDGENGKTIGQKMQNAENWTKMASKFGQGCYILPYLDAIMGLVYNHDLFVKNGWLSYAGEADKSAIEAQGITYEEEEYSGNLIFKSATCETNFEVGDIILTAGKDGKYGTYDDGQPQTEEEFDCMIEDITKGNVKAKAFINAGMYDQYSNHLVNSITAQYVGPDMFNKMLEYDTKGEVLEMHKGEDKAVAFENGYQVLNAQGIYEGLRFTNKYLNDETIVDENSFKTQSYSHTDAQNDFLLGYKKSTGYPAMLVEGVWWENEARPMFKSIEIEKPERGYGKQDYRYMVLPAIEGQKGIDGQGNGTVFSASDTGGIVMKKQTDSAKLAKLKEFLCMTLTDEVLVDFTKTTGIFRPFDYTLTSEDLAQMTPFARNVYSIYNDKENVTIVRVDVTRFAQPITFTSSMDPFYLPLRENKLTINASYMRTVRNVGGVENALNTMVYNQENWTKFINDAKEQGFYK